MKSIKTILLIVAATFFIIVIGGGMYEHIAIVPKWKQAPPESLAMFQGKYGINPGNFWEKIHPVALALLIAALVANWKTPRKRYILITITGYAVALVVTFLYFVPELLSIIHTPYLAVADNGLIKRAGRWEMFSLIRLGYCFALAVVLLYSLTKGYETVPAITKKIKDIKRDDQTYRDIAALNKFK
ncbi:MAG: hypothetical protein ABI688_07535 [Bacteroidota bacterium]